MQMEGREGTETLAEQRDGARDAQPGVWVAVVPGSAFCVPETVVETVGRTKRRLCGGVVLGTARVPCSKRRTA